MKKGIHLFFISLVVFIVLAFVQNVLSEKNHQEKNHQYWKIYLEQNLPQILYEGNLIRLNGMINLQDDFPIYIVDTKNNIISSNDENSMNKKANEVFIMDQARQTIIHYKGSLLGTFYIGDLPLFPMFEVKFFLYFIILGFVLILWKLAMGRFDDYSAQKNMIHALSGNIRIDKKTRSLASPSLKILIEAIENFRGKIQEYESFLRSKTRQQVKTQVARKLAHDMKSPLSVLDLIYKEGQETGRDRDLQQVFSIALGRLKSLSETILEKSSEPLDVKWKLEQGLQDLVQEKCFEHFEKVKIHLSIEKGIKDIELDLDKTALQRSLSNILNNAIEACGASKERPIVLEVFRKERYLVFCVSDEGRGIPDKILQRLQLENFSFGKSMGHGLGLSQVREFVRDLKGEFLIDSKEGQGTKVELRIPHFKAPSKYGNNVLPLKSSS